MLTTEDASVPLSEAQDKKSATPLTRIFGVVNAVWKKVRTLKNQSSPAESQIYTDIEKVTPTYNLESVPVQADELDGKTKYEKYKRIKRIGAGAQSTCILASIDSQQVIMKSFITAEEFKQEVSVLQHLQHDNIVGYIDSFSFTDADGDEKRYLILEYCNGGDLSNVMRKFRKKKMPEKLFLSIMLQVLKGIDFIHAQEHVHRDIKPKNLLMHGQVVKIGDFGFSSNVHDKTAVIGGSAVYLSPEFMENQYEPKIDVWSVGCTAVELVTNKERDLKQILSHFKRKKN
jgi:serine/threonine protein kinase